jgi:hypothetical protein
LLGNLIGEQSVIEMKLAAELIRFFALPTIGVLLRDVSLLPQDGAFVELAAAYQSRISAPFICTTPLRLLMSA